MGGKSAPAPNYAPLMQMSRDALRTMGGLGQQQLAFAQQQYADLAPTLRGIAQTQQAAQEQQMSQAKDYYDYMRSTYRPVEQGLVQQAQKFNTEQYREQMASQAAADAGRAFAQTQAASQRAMAGMGVNPNSGRFASMQTQSNLGLAAQRAAAMTGTRQQASQMGYARMLDAAGLGRGLSGASTAAYQGATGAGSAAGNMYMAPGNQFMQGMGQAGQTMGQGYSLGMQGMNSVLGSQTSLYNTSMNNESAMYGALLSAGGNLGAAGIAKSDIRVKENIERVGTHYRNGLPIYEFNYIHVPDKRYRGVMAQDVEKVYPEAVVEMHDGIKAVNYDMLGMEMVEV
jgi:hypothetical protein